MTTSVSDRPEEPAEVDNARQLAEVERAQLDEHIRGYRRSPIDAIRALIFLVGALLAAAVAHWARDAVLALEQDLILLVGQLDTAAERVVAGTLQVLVTLFGLAFLVVPIVLRRYRVLGSLGLMWLTDRAPRGASAAQRQLAAEVGLGPNEVALASLAGMVAAFTVLAVFVSARYRRAGAVALAVVVVGRLFVAVDLPVDLLVVVLFGATAGCVVLFAFGRPDSRPTASAISAALASGGLDVATLAPADVESRRSTPYVVTLTDGSRLFAKVVGGRERSADLLFRTYRFLRLKNVGDERPFSSLRRAVEHEAMVALLARDSGVATPRLRVINEVGRDSMVLCYEFVDGTSLDHVDPATVDDALLDRIWRQAALLRRPRIAHRDLRRSNILVDPGGGCWLIDFGFSEVAVADTLVDADTAQLLAATSVAVGAERSVDAAVRVLGPAPVASSLRLLQPTALSSATRVAMKAHPGLLKDLQATAAARTGVETPTFEQLDRFSPKSIFSLAMLAAVTYFLLPQFADLPGIVRQVQGASWGWAVPTLVMSALTYVGAAMGVLGAVPDRVSPETAVVTQVAAEFTGKIAPAGLGGMALNVRFLQRSGVDPAVATSGVGLSTVAGLLMHIVLLVVFTIWGQRTVLDFHLPRPGVLLLGFAAVAVVTAVGFAIPAVRHIVLRKVFPIVRRAFVGIGRVLRRPSKVALLFGGSAILTLAYIGCLYFAGNAFGMDISPLAVAAIYLVASAVATAAPTPGGLGALEAALIAGLIAAGVSKDVAVPTVFFFRLMTFWLPILPGWIAFRWLRREQYV